MRIQNLILIAFLTWFGLEFLAFFFVVHEVGLSGALLLGLLTTIAGFSILRRIGLGAALVLRNGLRDNLTNHQIFSEETIRNGSLATFGALLLILPGFVSDLIGFCLVTPAVQSVFRKIHSSTSGFGKPNRARPPVVELSPQEWSRVEKPQQNTN